MKTFFKSKSYGRLSAHVSPNTFKYLLFTYLLIGLESSSGPELLKFAVRRLNSRFGTPLDRYSPPLSVNV